MLFEAPELDLRLSRWLLVVTLGVMAAGFLVAMTAGARALRRPPMLGARGMIGATGVARGALVPEGQVYVGGELWRAVAEGGPVEDGRAVRVVDVEGLTLRVVKVEDGGGTA
jgi:membrane-bound serine protease (ClpP class)